MYQKLVTKNVMIYLLPIVLNLIDISLLYLFCEVGLNLLFKIRLRGNILPIVCCVWIHAWLDMHKITQQKISIWFNTTTRELGLVEKIVSLQRNKIGIRIRSIGFFNSFNLNRIILEFVDFLMALTFHIIMIWYIKMKC